MQLNNAHTEDFSIRLKKAVGDQSNREFAKRIGVSPSGFGQYISGKSEPTRPVMIAIADVAQVNLEWLATGAGPMRRDSAETSQNSGLAKGRMLVNGTEYALIPLYDIRASAGPGREISGEENKVGTIPFRLDWIKGDIRASIPGLRAIHIEGDSMIPTLSPGDQALVDTQAREIGDGIYLLRIGGALLVKRIQRQPSGQVRVASDNPAYHPFVLDVSNLPDDVAIIGRVVWHGKWL